MFTFCHFSAGLGTNPVWTKPALLGRPASALQRRFIDVPHGVWGSELLGRMGAVGTGEALPLHWFLLSVAMGL